MSQTLAPSDAWIDSLIAAHRPGYALAQPFYRDPEVFARDVERIFLRHFVIAGHASRLPAPGDYFLFEIAGESIILMRGRDGQVRGFFNVCRHRGSRVCLEPQGHVRSLVCPYHAWVYGTEGQLLSAQAMPEGFDAGAFGLKSCPVRTVEGIIFVCLGDQPSPHFDEAAQEWERFLRPHDLPGAKIAASMSWRLDANWKLVVENFAECYHCAPTHPEYCSVMAHAGPDSTGSPKAQAVFAALSAEWEDHARRLGTHTGKVDPITPESLHVCSRIPIKQGFLTQSADGKPLAPLMGSFQTYDGGYTAMRAYPLNYAMAASDFALLVRFTPLAPTQTDVELIWLVRADAVEGRDYDLERLVWLWKVTTEQDKKIVEDNQAGVNSRAYEPGPYSQVESGCVRFTQWYLRQIGDFPTD